MIDSLIIFSIEKLNGYSISLANLFSAASIIAATLTFFISRNLYSLKKENKESEHREKLIKTCLPLFSSSPPTLYERAEIDISFHNYAKKTVDHECIRIVLQSDLPHRNLEHLRRSCELLTYKKNIQRIVRKKGSKRVDWIKLSFLAILLLIGSISLFVPLNLLPAKLNEVMTNENKKGAAITYMLAIFLGTIIYFSILFYCRRKADKIRSLWQLERLARTDKKAGYLYASKNQKL